MGDDNNVMDFTAYKMRNLIEDFDKRGQTDYAMALQTALDAYLLGEVRLGFIDGVAYILEDKEDLSL